MRLLLLVLGLAAMAMGQDDDIVWLDNYAEAVKMAKAMLGLVAAVVVRVHSGS